MALHRDITSGENFTKNNAVTQKPSSFSIETLSRTLSDISLELINQETLISNRSKNDLSPISEVEDAKCEGCGMCEECTPEYVKRVREKFSGRMVCGLCSEAVKEEMEKNGGKLEEALCTHVYTCARFNRLGRAYPVLCQAEAMREMLKNRAKSLSPRDKSSTSQNKSGIIRSSSCIPDYYKGNWHSRHGLKLSLADFSSPCYVVLTLLYIIKVCYSSYYGVLICCTLSGYAITIYSCMLLGSTSQ